MSCSLPLSDAEAVEQMERHGITPIVTHEYRYKDYRYSNLADAIAQADRDKRSS